jgi:CRISPR system Cascade subunit CasA
VTIATPEASPMAANAPPSYNLWTEPWITTTDREGRLVSLGIRDCLVRAHELRSFYDPSPLVIASLQRLLAAVAQAIVAPEAVADVADLIEQGHFDVDRIDRFGSRYGQRFDLFSETEPFMQTADIGTTPKKGEKTKTVGYLFFEEPTGTNINHFRHGYDDDYQFSPATAARGLITLSAFATTGGAGIKPSINGVPPLYVLPAGETLFETLALSVIAPEYQPRIRSERDKPAWARDGVTERGKEVLQVGYIESLTFPARRVRLFPERRGGYCSRSGEWCEVLVREMVFEMGFARPKDAETWFDPFAAYKMQKDKPPIPVRPSEGKALWREYGNLFQTHVKYSSDADRGVAAPLVVLQLAEMTGKRHYRFRCIGMRTDMKAKIFEWVDDTLDVPSGILADEDAQLDVQKAVQLAEGWGSDLWYVHNQVFGDGHELFKTNRVRMRANYWTALTGPFIQLVQGAADPAKREAEMDAWARSVFTTGQQVFSAALEEVGDRGANLRQRVQAEARLGGLRARRMKEWRT